MNLRRIRAGDVLELSREPVDVNLSETYRQIGVRGFGRGIFDYDSVPGAQLGKMRYFTLGPSRLVVSNIKGWEGAVAVTGKAEEGRIASNRFLTFLADPTVDLDFIRHYLVSGPGLDALGQASPGSADRNRTLSIKKFENIVIPLPEVDEQRRIGTHLNALAAHTDSVVVTSAAVGSRAYLAALPSLSARLFSAADLPTTSVDQLCSSVNDTVHPGDDRGLADVFVGLEHVEPHWTSTWQPARR